VPIDQSSHLSRILWKCILCAQWSWFKLRHLIWMYDRMNERKLLDNHSLYSLIYSLFSHSFIQWLIRLCRLYIIYILVYLFIHSFIHSFIRCILIVIITSTSIRDMSETRRGSGEGVWHPRTWVPFSLSTSSQQQDASVPRTLSGRFNGKTWGDVGHCLNMLIIYLVF